MRTLFANAHVVTMDDAGTEIPNGWLVVDHGFIEEVGAGNPPPAEAYENLGGALVTPGLVNTHHHPSRTSRARVRSRPTSSPG
jgi:cytosine/adenosine deaminase-related metal-dependent hydrolase